MLKSKITRIVSIMLAAMLIIICITGCGERKKREYEGFFFDTYVTIRIYGGSDEILNGAAALCREYDRLFSKTNPASDIWALNNADSQPVTVDERTVQLLEQAGYYTELSGGRFDVTCGSVTSLWDFKNESPMLPDSDKLSQAIEFVGMDKLKIDGCTVTLQPGTQIDLGAIAKGYIADKVAEYLRENGVENAVINFGGNVVVIGDKFGEQYTIGIESPFGNGNIMALSVSDKSIVTAGTYQRGFMLDGVYYHHIIDLSTGMPANNELASVTVLSESSAQGDALATTLFLMGLDDGLALAESMDDIEAVFVTNSSEVIKTSGLS